MNCTYTDFLFSFYIGRESLVTQVHHNPIPNYKQPSQGKIEKMVQKNAFPYGGNVSLGQDDPTNDSHTFTFLSEGYTSIISESTKHDPSF